MLWSLVLLLAFLAPGNQKASNMGMRQKSIIRPTEASIVITCELDQNTNYVHLYRYQEGRALHRLLYYNFRESKAVLDSGFSSEKYHVYKGTGRTCKIVLRNLEKSDSAVFYCATWEFTQ